MHKLFKKLTIICLLLIVSIFSISTIYASNDNNYVVDTTSYIPVDSTTPVMTSYSTIFLSFKDNSDSSSKNFGIVGSIINTFKKEETICSKVSFYTEDKELIASKENNYLIKSDSTDFSQMFNLDILNGYDVQDIRYYKIDISPAKISDVNEITPLQNKHKNYSSYDYIYDSFDVNIVVNNDNSLDITETFTINYNIPSHGIIRTIPIKNEIERLDNSNSTTYARITDIYVDAPFKKSIVDNTINLKIGDKDKYVEGKQTYTIKYNYALGKDDISEFDELYFNIIGTDIDVPVHNITFKISMPHDFDTSKLGFSSGKKGSTTNSNVYYNVSNNVITGYYSGILDEFSSITVRCELPEGYFTEAKLLTLVGDWYYIAIAIMLLISFILFIKYGKDKTVVAPVEFFPPEDFNSLDIAYIYKGKVGSKDVTSLLIYLANKGYIEILPKGTKLSSEHTPGYISPVEEKIADLKYKLSKEKYKNPNSPKIKYYENLLATYQSGETPQKSSIKAKYENYNFVIRKLKDYDGTDENERRFMKGLFAYGRTEVTDKMLEKRFYTTTNAILDNKNSKSSKYAIYEKESDKKKKFITLFIFITCLLTFALPIQSFEHILFFIGVAVFFLIGFTVFMATIKLQFPGNIFAFTHGIAFGVIPIVLWISFTFSSHTSFIINGLIGLVITIIMIILRMNMSKRTEYGNIMLGRIKGFRNFLVTARKEELEALVEKHPTYFYDILPYTYVLGISKKWISKFENIHLTPPNWSNDNTDFNINRFNSFMNSTIRKANRSMSSLPASSGSGSGGSSGGFSSGSSSSSSGGGRSGGGSGGGGSRRW